MDSSKCLDQNQLLDYLRGALSAAEAQAVEEHLSACETCEACVQTHDGLSDALFTAFQAAEVQREQFTAESHFQQAMEAVEKIAAVGAAEANPAIASTQNRPAAISLFAMEASAPAAPPPPALPRTVGEYELLERLGSGGMGTVYKARHLRLNRIVAVKMLLERRLNDATATARFDREMMAVGALDHPNIVRATDAREVDGQRLLVMELVDGVDLALLVRRAGPLPIADACEIIRQAALGLQSAHDRGLVHRDIKPSNLMLSILPSPSGRGVGGEGGAEGEGVVKVLDLGLAMFQEPLPTAEEVTDEGQALGTAEYTSPEQISDSHEVDRRTDIYSLGCTLFKLLTGQAPFEGPQYLTRIEKLSAHLLKTVPDVRTLRPEVPAELAELLQRMTARMPDARFASMAELADALLKFRSGHDLPRLLKRAAAESEQTAANVCTEELYSSALVSTGGSKRLQSGRRGKKWPRLRVLGAMAAGVLLAAVLIVRWRDSSGRERTVETSEPSRVTIDKDGAVAIVPMQGSEKANPNVPGNPVAETVALKDFFKDVRGRWVAVLTSEKDLASCRIVGIDGVPLKDGVAFHANVVDIDRRFVFLPSFRSSVQGIRAKVRFVIGQPFLFLRSGPDGASSAFFSSNGFVGIGAAYNVNGKSLWSDLRTGNAPPKPRDGFLPIGFAAIGERFVCEVNGDCQWTAMDNRITFGEPGIGAKVERGGRALFKEIEVFVPDKDFDKVPNPTSGTASVEEITNGIGVNLVRVKPGQFYMGSPQNEANHLAGEELHDVKISKSFYIGKCEITQEQYQAVIGTNPSSFSAAGRNSDLVKRQDTRRYPVECVSWDDARTFCEKLSAREHRRYRLPTEAEWEYCCRASTETPFCFGGGINMNNANSNQTYGGPMKAGVFPENKWGICDMHGNVAEWCQDYFSATYYKESPASDPPGPALGVNRVVRGGSWNGPASRCRSAARFSEPPATRRDDLGFRIVTE